MVAKVVSFINLKGGVGKTTLAMAIGEILAFKGILSKSDANVGGWRRYRILLIDLDSQANLTMGMVEQRHRDHLESADKTTYHLFNSALLGAPSFDVRGAITSDCSNIERYGSTTLDILISQTDLGRLDEELLKMLEKGRKITRDLRLVLKSDVIDALKDRYDYIMVDCPPSISVFTSNALIASDYWVAPIVPEWLSLQGVQTIIGRITDLLKFDPSYGGLLHLEFKGSIVNRVDIRRKDHKEWAENIYGKARSFFQPFDDWMGDIRPLYLVTDYEVPFERGTGYGKWASVEGKYTYGAKRRKNPVGTVLERGFSPNTVFGTGCKPLPRNLSRGAPNG